MSLKRVRDFFPEEQITKWRDNGLDDYEADRIAIGFGLMPHAVWPGWTEAGLDCDVYP